MSDRRVLLRRDGETARELGVIVSRKGTRLQVRDSKGAVVERAKGPKDLMVTAGTVAHLVWVAPEQVEIALAECPELLFKQLLHESGEQTARDLKAKLSKWSEELDGAWTRAKPALEADPAVSGPDDKDCFSYLGDSVPGFADLFPQGSFAAVQDGEHESAEPQPPFPEPAGAEPPATAGPAPSLDAGPPAASTPPAEQDTATTAAEPAKDDTRRKGRAPARRIATGDPIAAFLESLGEPLLFDIALIVERPLRAGRAFNRMSAADQRLLVNALHEGTRRLFAVVAGSGKAELLAAHVRDLRPVDFREPLETAIHELARDTKQGGLAPSLVDLLHRASAVGEVPAPVLLRVCSVTSRSDRAATDGVLDLVAQRLRATSAEELRGWDLDLLARAMETTDFTRRGGRTAALAALYAVDRAEAAKGKWWSKADLAGLAEAARGGLARALEDEEVSTTVVAPLVRAQVKSVAARSGMATLWNLPSPLASHITGNDFAQLMASLAESDSITAEWRDAVLGADVQAQRARQLEEAEAHAARAIAAREAAETQAARLEADLVRTADLLHQARAQGIGATEQRERQNKIDAVRALATLAAQVLQSDGARSDEALVRALRHTCAREGLTAIGDVGEVMPFDPALHDSLGQSVSEGSTVSVVRAGYTWTSGGEELVLLKPQVVLQGD